jgi:hypothetical protein
MTNARRCVAMLSYYQWPVASGGEDPRINGVSSFHECWISIRPICRVLQPAKFEPSSPMKTSTTRTGFSSLT